MKAKAILASLVLALSTIPTGKVDAALEEQRCLTLNIYAESRNTTSADEAAVGFVTINRTKSSLYPTTICKVVYQKNQFSWTKYPVKIVDNKAFTEASNIAELILDEQLPDVSRGAVAFHERRVRPKWTRKMDVSFETAVHIYYRLRS